MIKLFYAANTCSLASHIALEEAAAPYTTVRLSFADNQQRGPEYLAINPKGRVPAMVTDRGILTETPAMLAYIAQSFPEARLAPLDDPFAFAEVQAFNSYLCSTVHMSPMRTACVVSAGSTIRPPSPRCSARCRNLSARASS